MARAAPAGAGAARDCGCVVVDTATTVTTVEVGSLAAAEPPGADRLIDDRYQVVRELGRGAMGVVYQVHDRSTGRDLALKQVLPRGQGTTAGRNERGAVRFRREFHTIAGLTHPCVVAAYEYGIDEQRPYYTMELLEGPTLRELLGSSVERCCRVMRSVASALAFLHARRLLHRDLKARNVRCDAQGRPKLLDFGVLATMGVAGDVAGTPPCIPPEAIWGLPLDARADLFGLGALAYRLLTGHHAYPAETVDELDQCWRDSPRAPSHYRSDIPLPLDELVLALLSIEAAGRPGSAAEVIARLDAIGGLEQAPELEVAQGWLQSARMVGRTEELRRIRSAVESATRGSGALLVVEGPSGSGKTRLLREAGLQAQLAGATVLRARGRGWGYAPYDVARQLARAMLRARPHEAGQAGRSRAKVLRRVIPELGRAPRSVGHVLGPAPAEDRLRLQQALLEWFVAVAERHPLVMLIDDIERCDGGSASLISALGHVAQTVSVAVVGAARTDVESAERGAVVAGERLTLVALGRDAVAELVRDWFGELSGARELVSWIHAAAEGSPLHCSELARHLVDEGVVAYGEGSWRLLSDPTDEQLPRKMAEAMDRRIDGLTAVGLWLGQALALWRGPAAVELCADLMDTGDLAIVFEALDELVFEEIIVGGDEGFDLSHDGVRDALLRRLDPEQRVAIHHRTAELIIQRWGPRGGDRQADLGHHLLAAGQRSEGAEHLERAGRRHYELRSFSDALPLLREALEVRRLDDDPQQQARCLELQAMLVRAGVIGDRAVVVRHADVTIDAYAGRGGLPLARRVARWMGRRVGLGVGLGVAYLRWWWSGRGGPSPRAAVQATVALANYVASVHAMAFDSVRVGQLHDRVAAIRSVGSAMARAASAMLDGFEAVSRGHWQQAHDHMTMVTELVPEPEDRADSAMDHSMFVGGALLVQAVVGAVQQTPTFSTAVDALRAKRMRFLTLGAEMSRVYYHRLRGEEQRAREILHDAELSVVQLGNSWAYDSIGTWVRVLAYGLTGDTMRLRQVLEELEHGTCCEMGLEPFAIMARAELTRLQGDPIRAREALVAGLSVVPAGQSMLELSYNAALVETQLDAGDHDEAIATAERALHDAPAGSGPRPAWIRLRCALARGLARQQRCEEARAQLDELVQHSAGIDSPLLVGLVHEAGCEVEGLADDVVAQSHHAARAELLFVSTGNPVLIARARRLVGSVVALESSRQRARVSDGLDTVDLEPRR